ncbi:MAG: hypothetical protein WAW51_17670, partial [Ilumatobacteraceae bacterium]
MATSEDINLAIDKGAVSQSETVKAEGSNADVLALADQIITAQQGDDARSKIGLGSSNVLDRLTTEAPLKLLTIVERGTTGMLSMAKLMSS